MILYVKGKDDYYPMKKVEWEEGKEEETIKGWDATYNDDTGELVWEAMVPEG